MSATHQTPAVLTAREGALLMAGKGYPVIPLEPNGKRPFVGSASWLSVATRDPMIINSWFDRTPTINYGCVTTGGVVIDTDVKNGLPGYEERLSLGVLPATLAVITCTKGRHEYFSKADVNQMKLMSAIDIKSRNNYVVGPGSVVDGQRYEIVRDLPVAPAPESLLRRLSRAAEKDRDAQQALCELDTAAAIEQGRFKLQQEPGAEQGGRNMVAFRLACSLKNDGLSPEMIAELLSEYWNDRNAPPLSDGELEQVAKNAWKSSRHAAGSSNPELEFGDVPGIVCEVFKGSSVDFDFTAHKRRDPSSIEPREWLYGRHYIRRFVTGTVAPGGTGKSNLALIEAISMVVGKCLITGDRITPRRVAYWNGEDPQDELDRRIEAICMHYGIPAEATEGKLFADNGRSRPLVFAKETREGVTVATPLRDAVITAIERNRIDVLIVDPFVRTHRVSENDNSKINAVAEQFCHIAEKANCSVELVHHVRKNGGAEISADDARGGSAFKDAVRSLRVLNQMTTDEGRKGRVDDPRRFFRIDDGKVNMVAPSRGARWCRLHSVKLGNGRPGLTGDEVAVVERWDWPAADEGLPENALDLALSALEGLPEYQRRADAQSKDWIGRSVAEALGLNADAEADRYQIKDLIKGWIRDGHLTTVEGSDRHRKPVPCLAVNRTAPPCGT